MAGSRKCTCLLPSCRICSAATCSCFLRGCPVCNTAALKCSCLLPGCHVCTAAPTEPVDVPAGAFRRGATRLTDSGRPPTIEMVKLIATVDFALREMLDDQSGAPKYLSKGANWDDLATWEEADGSRHDHVVAYLCCCGVHAVRAARQTARLWEEGRTLKAPLGKQQEPQLVRRVPLSKVAPQSSTGRVLGRAMLWSLVHNVPGSALTDLFAQFALAGVEVGQRYHHDHAVAAFGGVASRLCLADIRQRFRDKPNNLQHPSCWRVIFDGVTIPNGTTLCVILVVFTDTAGDFAVEFVGAPSAGISYDGAATASKVFSCLDDELCISQNVPVAGAVGLPLRRLGMPSLQRGALLTSINVDRAYCGRTGNDTDKLLGALVRLPHRVGKADLFHCYDSCAHKAIYQRLPTHATSSSSSSASSSSLGASSDTTDDKGRDASSCTSKYKFSFVVAWIELCRGLRAMFKRGQCRVHLNRAYASHGMQRFPLVQGPGTTRMVVYSNSYMHQSFRHYSVRYDALLAAVESLAGRIRGAHGSHRHSRRVAALRKRISSIASTGAKLAQTSPLFAAMLIQGVLNIKGGFLR